MTTHLIVQAIFLSVSATAAILGVLLFCCYRKSHIHPGPVLFFLFLSSGLSNLFCLALIDLADHHEISSHLEITKEFFCPTHDHTHDEALEYLMWVALFFWTASTLWYVMLVLDVVLSAINPFLPFRSNPLLHHMFVWPSSIVFVTCVRGYYSVLPCSKSMRLLGIVLRSPRYVSFVFIVLALVFTWRHSRRFEIKAHLTTRKMARKCFRYVLVFGLVAGANGAAFVDQYIREKESHFTILLVQLMDTLETILIFFLFCIDIKITRALRKLLGKQRSHLSVSDDGYIAENGIESDFGLPSILRMEIMKHTALGIVVSAEKNRLVSEETQSPIDFFDYDVIDKIYLHVRGEKQYGSLEFHDCAPRTFSHLRELAGIDTTYYEASFSIENILQEHGSEGKSGNIFYFTANRQFMVKTIPKSEYQTLRHILPAYHRYLMENPSSLLCRFYGCHSISLPIGRRRMYFVVMQNLFGNDHVDQRFDLKGNTDRRQSIKAKSLLLQLYKQQRLQFTETLLLDIDFLMIHRQMFTLSHEHSKLISKQLINDCAFLSSINIMDYSILMGVRYCDDHLPQNKLTMGHRCGVASGDGLRYYHIGVIDILQQYSWRWKLQRLFLGYIVCKDIHDISAVSPIEYAFRLIRFIKTHLFKPVYLSSSSESELEELRSEVGSIDSIIELNATFRYYAQQSQQLLTRVPKSLIEECEIV